MARPSGPKISPRRSAVSRAAAARFVGLSIRTLEKHRIYGTGPRYSKLGGRVVYRVEDLQAWVESGLKASTSDPGKATVLPAKRQAPIVAPPANLARR